MQLLVINPFLFPDPYQLTQLMSELGKGSTEIDKDPAAKAAAFLLANYHFDLAGYPANELVERWLNFYPGNWVRLAVVEALYQGRYKAISVEQILTIWQRRNQAIYHFNYEFEHLICSKLPDELTQLFSSKTTDSSAPYQEHREEEIDESDRLQGAKPIDTSHPFEAIANSTKPTISLPQFPETQVDRVSTPGVDELSSPDSDPSLADPQTSNLDVTKNAPIIDLASLDYSDRPIDQFTPDPPFSDLFSKLKAIAKQHQELLIAQQEDAEVQDFSEADVSPPEAEESNSLPESSEIV